MQKIVISLLVIFFFFNLVYSQESTNIGSQVEIGIDEQLNEYLPEKITMVNEMGDTMVINDLIDKPTILTLVYYRCPGLCTPLMDGLSEVIEKADVELGNDYQVFTISFDPSENYSLAVNKKANYLSRMENKQKVNDHWMFFTADSANIEKVTDATGFRYKPQGNDFVHSASLIFISPDQKITRYLNGTYFLPFEFKMAVLETSEGKSGPTINRVLQYCYSYDPEGQKYALNITKVMGISVTFIAFLIFLILTWKPIMRKLSASRNKEQ